MMQHIRDHDWTLPPETDDFLTESDLDNSIINRILNNTFHNPLASSDDSEEDVRAPPVDWDLVFGKRNVEKDVHRLIVPGLRPPPRYTRLSALTSQQHQQGIAVLASQNPMILEEEFIPRPTKQDYKAFEDMKELYEKEQKEYIAWAKTLWTNGQFSRALRLSPIEESVYEAEFKMRAARMNEYPNVFAMVAQIPLDAPGEFEMSMQEELIGVDVSQLPKIQSPDRIRGRLTVRRPGPVPAPCNQHPVQLVLPNETAPSVLPLIEVHRELAQFAADNKCQFVASEGALRCLPERRPWALPVSVFSVLTNDALRVPAVERSNVIVLGSEFFNKQESVLMRSFRANRHLLEQFLLPPSELVKLYNSGSDECAGPSRPPGAVPERLGDDNDDFNKLTIDFPEFEDSDENRDEDKKPAPDAMGKGARTKKETRTKKGKKENTKQKKTKRLSDNMAWFGVYECECKDSIFERPPARSFRKWQFKNKTTQESYNLIVHSAHKFKDSSGEVLVEPIVEYQSNLGASKQTDDRISSLSLSLALRNNASVVKVRLDAYSGDVITVDSCTRDEFELQHGDRSSDLARTVHTALDQLQGLVPGQYVIQHEPIHGDNALLYAPRNTDPEHQLKLEFDCAQLAEADEANSVKTPPELIPVMLPCHKFRKILPCAFTYLPGQIVKPKKKTAGRQKTPPRALRWLTKRGGRKPKAN